MYIKSGNVGYPEEEILEVETIHNGMRKRKVAQLTVIHHRSGTRCRLTIKDYELHKNGTFVEFGHIRLDENATDKLFRYLLTRENFANLAQTTFYTVVESIAPLDRTTIEQLAKLLRRASRNKQIANILPADVVSNFAAVVHQMRYSRAVEDLQRMLDEKHNEKEYEDWFLQNPWVFGTEYLATEDIKIGWRTSGDIILTSIDGYQDIVELKLPSETVLLRDESHDNWYPSASLSVAISQAIKYIQESEDVRTTIVAKEGVPFLKPRAKIVIGRSNDWLKDGSDKRLDCLRKLNAQLHNIQIMTYDHLLLAARVMLTYYGELNNAEGGERNDGTTSSGSVDAHAPSY